MPSYQQLIYCKDCKTNVGLNEKGHCKRCDGSHLSKKWSVRFRIPTLRGEIQKRLTGFDSKKECDKAYAKFITNYKITNQKTNDSYIFEKVLENYLSSCGAENEESTLYDKRGTFNLFMLPYFKGCDVRDINKLKLSEWQSMLFKTVNPKTNKPYSFDYLSKIRNFLSHFFTYCEQILDIPNLFKIISPPKNKEQKKEISFWELKDFNNFIKTVDNYENKILWLTFFYTGARFNEVRAFSDDDIGEKTLITKALPGKKSKNDIKSTKNRKNIKKDTPKILVEEISKYKEWKKQNNISSKFLFGGDKPLSENYIRRRLNNDISNAQKILLEKNIKLNHITPHGFRHSYVSMFVNLHISTKVIADLIGDTEQQIIETYGHLYKETPSNVINSLNTYISEG